MDRTKNVFRVAKDFILSALGLIVMNGAMQRLQGLPAVLAPIVRLRKEELA